MPFVDVGGVSIHYRHRLSVAGRPTLVFINSLGTDFRIWDDVADRLTADASVLAYDKRGHGLSGLGGGVRSIDDHVDDLAGLLDRLGIDELVLCGLSIGGLVAQGFVARRPRAVRGLILCDTAAKIGTAQSWDARIETVQRDGIEAIADSLMEKWFAPAFYRDRPADLAGYRAMLVRQPVVGYVGSCAALREADHTGAARGISAPTLCVVGDQDGSTPPDLVRETAALIPGARFEIIIGAGHIPCVERPEALASLIRGFIASLPGEETMKEPVGAAGRYAAGLEVRRAVLGDTYVERARKATTEFDRPFQQLITEAAWGSVWSRPQWTKRERSMVTLALLAALGHDEEVAMHVRATANTGATREDICEAFLHVAIYAGVPAANRAIKIAKEVFAEMDSRSDGK